MTPEELLKPRYEVIADYPNASEKIGSVIELPCRDWVYADDNDVLEDYFESFPAIFRKLKWWEKRDIEDMPEYVKIIKTRPSYGLQVGCVREVSKWDKGKVREWICDLFPIYASIEDLAPATFEEYNQYINPQTPNQ